MKHLGMREGFDIGLEMSGAPPAVRDMLTAMTHGGRIAMLGLPSDEYAVNYGREMFDTWYAMSAMLHTSTALQDALRSVITHRFAVNDFGQAFDTVAGGNCGKVLLDWS